MVEASPAVAELFGGFFESEKSGLISGLRGILIADRLDALLGHFQGMLDVRFNGCGNQCGPADVKIRGEEWMHAEGMVGFY